MTGRFEVQPEALSAAVAPLTELAVRLGLEATRGELALSAAAGAGADAGLAASLANAEQALAEAVAAAASVLTGVAAGLEATGAAYRGAESASRAGFQP